MSDIYKIKNITHKETGLPRRDGVYPLRVGRIVSLDIDNIHVGKPLILNYLKDKNGNDYSNHYLRCSDVKLIKLVNNRTIHIVTNNSVYVFEKEEGE